MNEDATEYTFEFPAPHSRAWAFKKDLEAHDIAVGYPSLAASAKVRVLVNDANELAVADSCAETLGGTRQEKAA